MRFKSILFLLSVLVFASVNAGNNVTIKTVVIDAGHGGKDPGAIGPGKSNEKDIALAVALKLGDYIRKNFPGVNIIYTRKTDEFLELHERADIANKNKADLFICIHCNSNTSPQIYGTSTYVLGLHRTEANLEVAKRENSVILMEGDRDKNYEFDPNSPEGNIIMSMKQNAFLDQSIDIASKIESQFEASARRKSLGVKQAGFYVLYKTTMPSILSEIGFVSNPDEEKFLTSSKGQDQIASALFKAFKEYKFEMENREGEPVADADTKKATEVKLAAGTTQPAMGQTLNTGTKETPPTPAVDDPTIVTTESGRKIRKPIENSSGGGISPDIAAKPAPKSNVPPKPANDKAVENKPAADNSTTSASSTKHVEDNATGDNNLPADNSDVATDKDNTPPAPQPSKVATSKPAVDSAAIAAKKLQNKPVSTTTATETKNTSTTTKSADNKPAVDSTAITAVKKHTDADNKPIKTISDDKKPENKPVASTIKTETKGTTTVKTTEDKPAPKETKVVTNKPKAAEPVATESGTVFKIQLFALKVPLKNSEREKVIKIFNNISSQALPSGLTRYYTGEVKSYTAAKKIKAEAVSHGYSDAFIVGFKNGERLSQAEMKAFEN